MKGLIFYLLLVLGTGWAVAGHVTGFGGFLLMLEILVGLASFVQVQLTARKLRFTVEFTRSVVLREQQAEAGISLKNPLFFPVTEVRFSLCVRDAVETGFLPEYVLTGAMGAAEKSTGKWKENFLPQNCGIYEIRPQEVCVRDYLGIWSKKLKGPFTAAYLSVLPQNIVLPETAEGEENEEGVFSRAAALAKAGRDSQEFWGIRAFQRNDMLKNIHWKLSAKEDELMVKEFAVPKEASVLVAADPGSSRWKEIRPEELDEYLETLAALCRGILEKGQKLELAWYCKESGDVAVRTVESGEFLQDIMEELLKLRPCEVSVVMQEYIRQKKERFLSVYLVDFDHRHHWEKQGKEWTEC